MTNPDRTPRHGAEGQSVLSQKGPDWWLMLRKFFQRGRVIASVAPSSRYMARAILRGINFETAGCIVELGAGTGPITAELLHRIDCAEQAVRRLGFKVVRLRHFGESAVIELPVADMGKLAAHRLRTRDA